MADDVMDCLEGDIDKDFGGLRINLKREKERKRKRDE